MNKLRVFESKVLRKIHGPKRLENGDEIKREYDSPDKNQEITAAKMSR